MITEIKRWQKVHAEEKMNALDVISILVSRYDFAFPNIARLKMAAAVIMISTADNERGFSDMKIHKPRLRSTLSDCTLEQLMRISLEGPPLKSPEFDELLQRAVAHWAGLKNRRCDQTMSWNISSSIEIARRKRKAERKRTQKEKEAKEKAGNFTESKRLITRREIRLARQAAVASAIASEQDSKAALEQSVDDNLEQIALSALTTEETNAANKAKAAAKKKKKKEASEKLLAELEKSKAPRRRVHSRQFLEAIENRLNAGHHK